MIHVPPPIQSLYNQLTGNTSSNPATGALLASIVANERPARILEIGRYAGVSTAWMHWAHPEAYIESFDPKPQDDARLWVTLEGLSAKATERVTLNKQASPALLGRVQGAYELILIDGDHRNPGVAKDLVTSLLRLAPGGMIIMHDVLHDKTWPDVRTQFEVLAKMPQWSASVLRTAPNREGGAPCGLGIIRSRQYLFHGCQTGRA
jgi:predicted O-methyltransferase YrrM